MATSPISFHLLQTLLAQPFSQLFTHCSVYMSICVLDILENNVRDSVKSFVKMKNPNIQQHIRYLASIQEEGNFRILIIGYSLSKAWASLHTPMSALTDDSIVFHEFFNTTQNNRLCNCTRHQSKTGRPIITRILPFLKYKKHLLASSWLGSLHISNTIDK